MAVLEDFQGEAEKEAGAVRVAPVMAVAEVAPVIVLPA